MKSAIALRICNKTRSIFIYLTTVLDIIICCLRKFILINKVIACIVWRIDIDHFHLVQIVLAQKLQDIKVVSLDIEILCIVKIHTFLATRA